MTGKKKEPKNGPSLANKGMREGPQVAQGREAAAWRYSADTCPVKADAAIPTPPELGLAVVAAVVVAAPVVDSTSRGKRKRTEAMYQHATFRRRSSSTSSTASTVSWASDHHHDESGRAARGSQDLNSAASSPPPASTNANVRTCEGMTADETRELWKCMVALQQRYGCYNSRRIDLAANAGDDGVNLMPNPFIIDTLNNSVIDLPDEGWEMLDRCLRGHHDDSCASASPAACKERASKPKCEAAVALTRQ
ncbi:hypothetical protein PCL_01442 [Purpureocillium lilacinum]|uniref:Uncharacterized protein n=1 Tax=Purpureocillium lilacinum TaxID=33203 RepID=A0A2U3E3H9_PURLI|nr:hypothetical protein PCL_01442 [Purpureocillium lilacinum]